MKNIIFICLFFLCTSLVSQIIDTNYVKVKSSWYARAMPLSLYTHAGKITDKMSQNIEVGRSFGVIDVGLVGGRINLRADSNIYTEARVTMDASQYGIFSNEISIGVGAVFNSRTPIMLEISYTIMAQVARRWGIGIVTGYYDFSGDTSDSSKTVFGLFLRYGLLRSENGGLLNRKMRMHHRGRK